ncbi:SRPBCC family protein [Caenispirillum salinarum]|uniref:hypothetical protein n=1 Tax=Caenispirillum salinarum TaxID=859058 RepID=UPI001267555B|nr:hypothetical protein [Caenispirillum salinarum]
MKSLLDDYGGKVEFDMPPSDQAGDETDDDGWSVSFDVRGAENHGAGSTGFTLTASLETPGADASVSVTGTIDDVDAWWA